MTLAEHLNGIADDLYKRRAALPKDATVSRLSLEAACAAIKDAVRFLPRALARQEITEEVGHVTKQRGGAHEPAADGAKSQPPAPPPAAGTGPGRNPCKVCGGSDHDGRRHRFDGKRAAAAAPAEAPASDDEDPEPAAAPVASWPCPILPTARRVGPQPAPRAVRHLLGAPANGAEGLTPCGALGESVLVTADKAKATCDQCLRLAGPKCGRCGGPKHGYGGCPLKGDSGVAELRRRHAEKLARAAAAQVLEVNEQPLAALADLAPASEVPGSPRKTEAESLPAAEIITSAPDHYHAPHPSSFAPSDEVPKAEQRLDVAVDEERFEKDRGAESINAPQLNLTSMAAPIAPLARECRAQVCGGCGAAGHNRRACPALFPREGAPSVKHEGSVCEKALVGASTLITPPPPVVMEPLPDTSPAPPALERARRKLAARASAMPLRRRQGVTISGGLTREERTAGAEIEYPEGVVRPRARADCSDMPRPCPFVSCSHHLYLDVNPDTGTLKLNFPHLEVWEMAETCSLDVADRGGITLEEVGAILNLTRERIRQVEVRGLAKIKDAAGDELGLPPDRS